MFLSTLQLKYQCPDRNCLFINIAELDDHFVHPYKPSSWGVYGIIWTGKSHYSHQFGEQTIDLPPDHFLFIGPDTINNFIPQENNQSYLLMFNSIFFGRATRDTYLLQTYPFFHDPSTVYFFKNEMSAAPALENIFSEIMSRATDEQDYNLHSDIIHKIIYLIMLFGMTRITPLEKKEKKLALDYDYELAMQFREEVSKNSHQDNRVSFYADLLNISPRKLREVTGKIFGNPPKDIIQSMQTEKAMNLLSNTDIPIKEISYSLGFSDPANFSIFFKNRTDFTPQHFRKKYNKHRLFANDFMFSTSIPIIDQKN